jgi:hypothetical protein
MTAHNLSEEQMVGILRNALVIAGQEMGDKGDHWPVIKATVLSLAKDWENLKIERDVDAEMKIHLYKQLEVMEKSLETCTPSAQITIAKKLKELREICDAYFSEATVSSLYIEHDSTPDHIKRARAIVSTLEGDENGHQ